jgi:hypothetical protein
MIISIIEAINNGAALLDVAPADMGRIDLMMSCLSIIFPSSGKHLMAENPHCSATFAENIAGKARIIRSPARQQKTRRKAGFSLSAEPIGQVMITEPSRDEPS